MILDKQQTQQLIAKRVAKEMNDGDVVNLGIGLPTLVANYVSSDKQVILQSENGFVGLGEAPEKGNEDEYITNAGGGFVTIKSGGAFFDSTTSFGIIRGGHVDLTVLGALQVDEEGNIAYYMIPGKIVPGMGGAMDLVSGAKKVIVAMEHTNRGDHKILNECTLPLTATQQVDMIVTEMAVMEVTDKGIEVKEVNPIYTLEEVKAATEADFIVGDIIDLTV